MTFTKNSSRLIAFIMLAFMIGNVYLINGQPFISSISLKADPTLPLQGSVQGGTYLVVKGSGFSTLAAQNQLWLGPYPCILLADGARQDGFTCATTRAYDLTQRYGLQAKLKVSDFPPIICNTNACKFSYTLTSTPNIQEVAPRTVVGDQQIVILGQHRITDAGDQRSNGAGQIINLMIDDKVCSTLDVTQQDKITPNDRDYIKCKAFKDQQAGQYKVTQHLHPGYAKFQARTVQTSYFTQNNYTQRIAAKITTMPYHEGGDQGQQIQIKGTGFSNNSTKYTCQIAGQICTVKNAQTTSLTVVIPPLDPSNTNYGALTQDADHLSDPNEYLGSNGFKYTRYTRDQYRLSQQWFSILRGANTLAVEANQIRTELRSVQINTTPYIEFWRGYFYAPVNGQYRFAGTADDGFKVKMSTIQNSRDLTKLSDLIYADQYSPETFNPYYQNLDSAIANRTLTTGYYYMEIVSYNEGGPGNFRVLVDMPQLLPKIANPTWHVDEITIAPQTITPQIVEIKVTKTLIGAATDFTIAQIAVVDGKNKVLSCTINWGATADEFATQIKKLQFYNFDPVVTLITKDIAGNPTNLLGSIQSYTYRLTYNRLRRALTSTQKQFYCAKALFTRVQNHSKPTTGTYKIKYNGLNLPFWSDSTNSYSLVDLPYDVRGWRLQNALNNLYKTDSIRVRQMPVNKFNQSINFIIQYIGILDNPVPLTIDTTGLRGGSTDVFVATVTTKRQFSLTRSLYNPLPYEFMRTAENKPQLYLKVNDIPSVCADCSYTFSPAKTLVATSASLSTDTLTVTLTNPGSIAFIQSDVKISLNGVRCNSITKSSLTLTCKFSVNSAGNAALPYGSIKPSIHLSQIGFAKTSSLSNINIPLILTSLTPSTFGVNGGTQATLVGKGFPLEKSGMPQVRICGNLVTKFNSIKNQQIKFQVPKATTSCGAGARLLQTGSTGSLTMAGESITATYDSTIAPIITSLSKTSASPILKSNLTINGLKFTNPTNTKVYLTDSAGEVKYQLTVVSVTSTQINCILGGGKTGAYYVRILDSTTCASSADANSLFNYQIIIDSISPVSGSLGGGYDITITGRNFASADSHTVFVGNAQNNICKITSATSTQIICTVPRIHQTYTPSTPYTVVVTGRILQESVCKGTCGFSYIPAVTNNVTVPSKLIYNAGQTVTINGNNLTGATVKIGGKSITLTSASATSISFVYPALKYGDYQVFIKTSTGYTHPKITTSTKFSMVAGLSRSSGSLNGHRISVDGNGYPQTVDKYLQVTLNCKNYSVSLPIISVVPTRLTFQTVPSISEQACGLNVSYQSSYINFIYTYKTIQTPSATITPGSGLSYTISTTSDVSFASFQYLSSQNIPTSTIYSGTVTSAGLNTYTVTPTGGYLPSGKFRILVHSFYKGYQTVTPSTFTRTWSSNPTVTATSSSFVGGKQVILTGAGFWTSVIQNNQIYVCGLRANIKSATTSSLTLQAPTFATSVTQGLYQLAKPTKIIGTLISDTPDKASLVLDDKPSTYYSSANNNCYFGFNFGSSAKANIQSIKYMPNPEWAIVGNKLQGAKFQGSNDNINWIDIFEIDTKQVHSSWNFWMKTPGSIIQYQYVRFSHNNVSKCQISDIQIQGIIYSTVVVDLANDKQCDVLIKGPTDITLSNVVTYSHTKTSTITELNPYFGPSTGGTVLTITGTNFGTTITVVIDGVNCPITSKTTTQIVCTTGIRATIPSSNSFVITSDGNPVLVISQPFLYMDRWSSQDTWGGQTLPRQGDSVYVPKGMTLLVDVPSTPVLDAIIVQGKIIFSDQIHMTLDTHYFIINGGQFTAGTEQNRYQKKLTITLHGGYYDKQLPTFGNKVLGCRNCKFNLHGAVRNPTWTQLASTVLPGATTLTVLEPVDWIAGQSIVVASSSFDHYEAQQMVIQSVSGDKLTITVTQPFKYKHYSAIENYDGVMFPMRAQVGLLTRNIKVQGNTESAQTQYGSHMMMNGKKSSGLVASFSYAEFTKCGQPKIIGRYCTHFHMTGQMPDSSVRGIAVHHSYARVLTIHGTHYLTVQKNVGYHVKGHNIFIEDGIQTNNVIQDNLIVSSIASLTLLQSDTSVASYWITNPFNTVRRNHAAGSDFYGFWYQIKQHPDGPSATFDICPMGMQVGESKDNVAHSNVRFGLRIFQLSARKYPCIMKQNQSAVDPYLDNPAIQTLFENYTLWRNKQSGFLGQQLGFTTIKNFKTADSKKGGLQFHKTNYTKQEVVAQNCLIVGYSQGNKPDNVDEQYRSARGFIASRTDGLRAKGITFYNFGPTMTPLQSCSQCWNFKLWVVGSKTTKFQQITYKNISGNYIFWQKWRRQIFMDLDGTLLAPIVASLNLPAQTKGSITPYRHSVTIPGKCFQITGDSWNHSTYCDQSITMRSILFTNANPKLDFNVINIKAKLLNEAYQNFSISNPPEANFSEQYMIIIKKKSMDIPNSWAMPFVVGKYYNIHWKWGIDFTHLSIAPSRLWQSTQGVVLRFNYTDNRQLFQIYKYFAAQLQMPILTPLATIDDLSPTNCSNGDYFHDNDARYLFVCVSGKNKAIRQWIDVNGIRCLNFCPLDQADGQRQNFQRLWSDIANWPNGKPQAGDNVTIPYTWNLILDQQTPIFNYVEINGVLIFDVTKNHTFQAHYIWVKRGIMRIGTPQNPYKNQATIVLHGEKDARYLVLDPDASGNKMLAVTGELQFYGNVTDNVWSKLTQIAPVGATSIKVGNTDGWKVGHKIVIAPTYSSPSQFQQVQITSISGNTINFTPALKYQHYGASAPITNDYGVIDTRGGVGLLSRNIKITRGSDVNGWGCRVLIYSYTTQDQNKPLTFVTRTGKVNFNGVQLDQCGQYDTKYAGLRLQSLGQLQENTQKPNIITRSSIHGSSGMGVWISKVNNLKFDNNVFYAAKKFLVYAQYTKNYTFTNNLLVGAKKRPELEQILKLTMMADDVACYEQYIPIDFDNDNVTVTKNLAQGAENGQGFVFPFAPCDKLSTYNFGGNTAGSCTVAFMFDQLKGYDCIGASQMVGYASAIGLMANPTTQLNKMIYQNVIFVDNQRGITLRFAHDIDDNTMIVRNSYFAGFSRPDCASCYADNKISYCKGGYAIRMFASTISGQSFPLKKKNVGFDVICTRQSFDMKSYFYNVTFENYLNQNPFVPYCSGMSVFKRHNLASDSTGSAYLKDTRCLNCQQNAWGYFDKPDVGLRGWFGGCGQLDCTGPNNYIIYDQDGKFTGRISQILANNSMVGEGQSSCTFNPSMNGYYCLTQQLAVMQYESIAPDFNLRIMWPVLLKYDTGKWQSVTNGWKQWQWDGPQPMNRRLARFVSVVKLHENYNLTYASQPPSDSRFQIQKRIQPSGNASDWVIIRIYYPIPNSIQVLVKNVTGNDIQVKPFPIESGTGKDLRNYVDTCGANNFHYKNGTIEFVLNGKNNCQVRVRLSSFLKISARLSIPILDFYNNNGVTTFISNICAFLNIDTGRLKIVGLRSGSTQIDAFLNAPINPSSTPAQDLALLNAQANSLSSGVAAGKINLGGPVIQVSTQIIVINPDGTTYDSSPKDNNKLLMIIILATVIPALILIIAIAGYCYIKRKRERVSAVNSQSQCSLQDSEKKMHKNYKREMIKVSQIPFQISKMSDSFTKC